MDQLGQRPAEALDPPVKALYVYNSNPAAIAPDQARVLAGLRREDLFTVVHEQLLTDTAAHADVVLPATTAARAPRPLLLVGPAVPHAQPAGARAARRGAHQQRVLPRARPAHGLHRALAVRVRRGDGEGPAREPPPLPRGRDLRRAPRARVSPPRVARALAALCRGELPHTLGEVRALLASPCATGGSIRCPGTCPWPRTGPLVQQAAIRWPSSPRRRLVTSTTRATRERRASAGPKASRACRSKPETPRRDASLRGTWSGSSTTAAR